jgi:ABC-type nickel/cobalt efflux system permease component RcnA
MRRRLRSATLILISQMLLVALAFAWLLQMVIIAQEGSAYFIERNSVILYGEIAASALIIIFGLYVLVTQIKSLGERRLGDRRDETGKPPRS